MDKEMRDSINAYLAELFYKNFSTERCSYPTCMLSIELSYTIEKEFEEWIKKL